MDMMTNQINPQDPGKEKSAKRRRKGLFGRRRNEDVSAEKSVTPTQAVAVSEQSSENSEDAMMAAIVGAITANHEQGAILAAITAAISVVWESEHPGTGFRVVSYRHISKRSPWNAR